VARVYQATPRVLASRKNGKLGGLARARKLSALRRSEISAMGGRQNVLRHGTAIYSFMVKQRETKRKAHEQKASK
jgi:hypothetical protein